MNAMTGATTAGPVVRMGIPGVEYCHARKAETTSDSLGGMDARATAAHHQERSSAPAEDA